jgi:Xaa-Pro aminopeptidase
VDSRYWSQAEKELAPTGIQMMKKSAAATSISSGWHNIWTRTGLSVDGLVLGLATARMLERQAAQSGFILKTDTDVTDLIWHDRASLPTAAVYSHKAPFAIVSRAEKLAQVRERMQNSVPTSFVSTVDDIAWIFNLRGADVSYNPVFFAHVTECGTKHTVCFEGKVPARLPPNWLLTAFRSLLTTTPSPHCPRCLLTAAC